MENNNDHRYGTSGALKPKMEINWIKEFDERFPKNYQVPIDAIGLSVMMPSIKSFISELLLEVIESIPEATKNFGEALDFNEQDQSKFSYAVLYHNARMLGIKQQLKDKYGINKITGGMVFHYQQTYGIRPEDFFDLLKQFSEQELQSILSSFYKEYPEYGIK